MERIFFTTASGELTLMGVNEAIQYAIAAKMDAFMVRFFDHRFPIADQETKAEMDLVDVYNKRGKRLCSGCSKPCIECMMLAGRDSGVRYTCSTCEKESFMAASTSLKGCGFMNSPDPGASFE